MTPKKSVSPTIDPKPLLAALGALDIVISELRSAAEDAQGRARKQVEGVLTVAVELRQDLEKRARKAGREAQEAPEHALNTGLAVASDANRRYEELATRGSKVVGDLLGTPMARNVAEQVDDATRLVESVRSAADKALDSLLSLTGLASRAGTAAERNVADAASTAADSVRRLADVVDATGSYDGDAPIRPRRPSRSSVKSAAARRSGAVDDTVAEPTRTTTRRSRRTTKKADAGTPPATTRSSAKRTTRSTKTTSAGSGESTGTAAGGSAGAKKTTTRTTAKKSTAKRTAAKKTTATKTTAKKTTPKKAASTSDGSAGPRATAKKSSDSGGVGSTGPTSSGIADAKTVERGRSTTDSARAEQPTVTASTPAPPGSPA